MNRLFNFNKLYRSIYSSVYFSIYLAVCLLVCLSIWVSARSLVSLTIHSPKISNSLFTQIPLTFSRGQVSL